MEENEGSPEDASKAIAALELKIEKADIHVAQLSDGVDRQRDHLASLDRRIADMQASTGSAVESARVGTAVIEEMRRRAEDALKQIEEDTRKANSESGFAFNAKGNAEEHAKVIAQIRGTVESTFSGLTSTKAQTDEAVQAILAARNAAEADAKAIVEAKATVTRDAAQVVAANERVGAVLPSIEQGNKDANSITAAKAAAEANAASIQMLHTQAAELMAKATADAGAVAKAEDDSKKLVASMTDARDMASDVHRRLVEYEAEIVRLTTAYSDMQTKLEGLLPHATSAGLASAFHNQKARFTKPQRNWLGLFVVTIIALLITGGLGLPASNESWDSIVRHFINRLPLVAPLVWLAIYAGHHYSMALRMEEDYAFKEAVSTAFEGYKREMLAIPASAVSDVSPLVTLCENVLQALAERPGRIYDGKTDMITPLTPAASILKEMIAEFTKNKQTKP